MTDLVLRNHENRPSLTSSVVAEERQVVSSNIWDGWRYHRSQRYRSLGSLASQYPGKMAELLVEIWNRFFLTLWWKVVFKTWCSTTQIRQKLSRKCTTRLIRHQNHNVCRNWLHKLVVNVSLVDWCARIRLDVRISLLEKEASTGSTLLSAWEVTRIHLNI